MVVVDLVDVLVPRAVVQQAVHPVEVEVLNDERHEYHPRYTLPAKSEITDTAEGGSRALAHQVGSGASERMPMISKM